MKTNSSVTDGGELRRECYREFAEYLAAYVSGYKAKHGVEIYAISPANEPDETTTYSSCRWTGAQFRDFIKADLASVFERRGISAKVVMPECNRFNEDYAVDALNDSVACGRVDIVGAHAYDFAAGRFPVAAKRGKPVWQTEVCALGGVDDSISDALRFAKLIHDHMTVAEVSAWSYWWLVSCHEASGCALISLDLESGTYGTAKRLYALGNFSRFVRPGFTRIVADVGFMGDVHVSAYKDAVTGEFAIVAINMDEGTVPVEFQFKGLSDVRSVDAYRTSRLEDLASLSPLRLSKGLFRVTLAGKSVTTFAGRNGNVEG
jgi:glucuronoarabinoxylan endo-1,4-beta-xylanase